MRTCSHNRPLGFLILLLAAMALPLTAPSALAQSAENADSPPVAEEKEAVSEDPVAPEVVVTATRTPEDPFDLAFSTQSITAKEIVDSQYRTTPEALREIPGVMIQKTAHGHGSPYIRGFTSFRNLFMVDGIRLNNSVFRPGPNQYWNTVDSMSIDRLEVVKGPTSVLYGSDAIGGTVNAFSKGPIGYGDGFNLNQRIYMRFSTAEQSQMYRYEVSATWDHRLGIYLGASYKDFGDLRGGRDTGEQHQTGYTEWAVDRKVEYFFNEDTKLVFSQQWLQQNDVPRTHRTIYSKSWEGTTIGNEYKRSFDQDRRLSFLRLSAENMDSFIQSMELTLSWHEQRETRTRIRTRARRDEQSFSVGTLGFTAQFESPTDLGHFTYGLEFYRDNVNSASSNNRIQGPIADEATYMTLGLYIQDEIELMESLDLTLGTRFTFVDVDADQICNPLTGFEFSDSDHFSALVGNARLVYHVIPDHLNIYGGIAQGFRAPNLSDLTRFDSARSNEIETPSFNLDPEEYLSYEVGIKASYEKLDAEISYYYTDINDMIIRTPTGRVIDGDFEVTKMNAGDGFVQGVEAGLSYRFLPQWTASGSIAWMDGEVDTFPTSTSRKTREPLSRLMPLTGQLGLRWDHPSNRVWIEGVCMIADSQNDLSTSDMADTSRIPPNGTPSYTTFSLRSGIEITENIDLSVSLENITDEDYRIHGSGLNEPGRSLNIGFSIEF